MSQLLGSESSARAQKAPGQLVLTPIILFFDFNKTGSVRFKMRMKLDSFFEFVFY